MKTITYYECEVCHNRHFTEASALRCEASGHAPEYQRGTIFNNAAGRGFFHSITFVVAENNLDGHMNHVTLWAFRDNSAGDSLGLDDVCGGTNATNLGESDKPCQSHPTFRRAVAFLHKHGIKPLVWNGKESVPL